MIIIYRSKPSNSARALVEALPNCRRAMNFDRRPAREGDFVICWGQSLANINGVNVLNGTNIINKFTAATKLKEAGVATVEVSRTKIEGRAQPNVFGMDRWGGNLLRADVERLKTAVDEFLTRPEPRNEEWLPRTANHIGGLDLLNPPRNPDYYSKKENLVEEFRIHCFKGKSIRAGRKVQGVEGVTGSHAWIRSLEAGWRISYDGFESTKGQRKLAKAALTALDLDFGAVDIGLTNEGKLIVLEVNRAPGLENNTITAYANAIQKWVNGEFEEGD